MQRNDFLLFCFLLLLALGSYVYTNRTSQEELVSISVVQEGRPTLTYELKQTQSLRLENELGFNVLEIKNGTAALTDSDCPNKLCLRQKITRPGQSIVCVPHGLVITGMARKGPELDAVAR